MAAEEVRIVAEEDCIVALEGAHTAVPWEKNVCADRLHSLPVAGEKHVCIDRLHSRPVVEEKQNHVGARELRWRLARAFRARRQAVSRVLSSLCGSGNLCRRSRRAFCVD